MSKKIVRNWGNYPALESELIEPYDQDRLAADIRDWQSVIARGNGRCYGDSALQKHIVSTLGMDKFLSFDREKGILRCESGVLLSDILELVVPEGFFLPVTPGTKFITLGGAVASNVHGKNHHSEGAFASHVLDFDILTDEGPRRCSRTENRDLFVATMGGMGTTGILTAVTIALKRIETSYIRQKSIKAANLEEILDLFEEYNDPTYSVAWIDCLKKGPSMGRSILMLGEHATREELQGRRADLLKVHPGRQLDIPFFFPDFTLNSLSIGIFNFLFYHKQTARIKESFIHYDPFFYPLDILHNWNRIYGKSGFTQYQFVIPLEAGREGMKRIMQEITNSGQGSFLAVLKKFGHSDEPVSPLSFPMEGYTLALDFKVSRDVFALLDRLDEIVLAHQGRLYLAKDARMSTETFRKSYPSSVWTPPGRFVSSQLERLS
jgi:decaprenylphospho-beta-D-ribofuranose 2-oxidase